MYDVEMKHIEYLKQYDSVECHLVLYPYSRKVGSQNITFYPFEEYTKDILTHQKSAYVKHGSQFNEAFGLLLGLVITLFFFRFKPDDLFSVESIVSVFGAYFVGKEIWDDIERILINLTTHWRLRFQENYYSCHLIKHTTLTHYSYFAKKQRYGITPLLPEKMDFIKQSNSQTVRLFFNMSDLRFFGERKGHLFSIHVDPDVLEEFDTEGFLFGVKISLNKRQFGVTRCLELFQSLHKQTKGALDEHGMWSEGNVFYRKTLLLGRFKAFLKNGMLYQKAIVEHT